MLSSWMMLYGRMMLSFVTSGNSTFKAEIAVIFFVFSSSFALY